VPALLTVRGATRFYNRRSYRPDPGCGRTCFEQLHPARRMELGGLGGMIRTTLGHFRGQVLPRLVSGFELTSASLPAGESNSCLQESPRAGYGFLSIHFTVFSWDGLWRLECHRSSGFLP
jgi:hypothetical protein